MRIWKADTDTLSMALWMAVVFAIAPAFVIGAWAGSDTPSDIVKTRQASMKAMADAGKTLAGMFGGKLPYNASAFKQSAEAIRTHSGDFLIKEFPAGSFGPPSAAKPDIDQSRDEFDALARKVTTFATVISAAADKAPDGITQDMKMGASSTMGSSLLGKRKESTNDEDISKLPAEHAFHLVLQACSSCHAKFREKLP